jgi:hypothetical protein
MTHGRTAADRGKEDPWEYGGRCPGDAYGVEPAAGVEVVSGTGVGLTLAAKRAEEDGDWGRDRRGKGSRGQALWRLVFCGGFFARCGEGEMDEKKPTEHDDGGKRNMLVLFK